MTHPDQQPHAMYAPFVVSGRGVEYLAYSGAVCSSCISHCGVDTRTLRWLEGDEQTRCSLCGLSAFIASVGAQRHGGSL